jgi:hypothetical protein
MCPPINLSKDPNDGIKLEMSEPENVLQTTIQRFSHGLKNIAAVKRQLVTVLQTQRYQYIAFLLF